MSEKNEARGWRRLVMLGIGAAAVVAGATAVAPAQASTPAAPVAAHTVSKPKPHLLPIKKIYTQTAKMKAAAAAGTAAYPLSGTQREPAVGEYDCNGIAVVINHSWATINGATNHRTSAFWIGKAISPGANSGDIDNIVQRDQLNGVSVGGWQRDFHSSHVTGWAQSLTTAYTPFHPGNVWSAFAINTWSPVGDFVHRCSIEMQWPPR